MRNISLTNRLSAMTAAFLLLTSFRAFAADEPREQDDPPERVARLSYLKGHVTFQSEDDNEWATASVNRPLTSGDRLQLEPNARAELQTGPIDIQVDEKSDFSFLELNEDVAQIRLTDGAIYLNVRRIRGDEVVEVDTPQAAVAISKPGEYAIAIVDGGRRTLVRTFTGECEVTDNKQSVALKSREQAYFADPDAGTRQAAISTVPSRNGFESWAHDRAIRSERSASSRYVDPDVIGYSDLDEYGDWVDEAEYGHVWIPRHVAVEWSPYRYGRWAWISPWGWTWVDDAPWGFAPFHYGRWANVRGRWCWVPGPLHVRPVYAPALVAWVGSAPPRSGVSVSISFGSGIGWFPLAPREIFVPSYYCSRRHIHNVNYANTVIVNNVYINRAYNNRDIHFDHVNRSVRNAITVVQPDAFTRSQPVREHLVRVNERDLGNWQTHNAINLQPRREGGAGPRIGRDGVREHMDRNERSVVMRREPSPTFAQRQNSDRGRERSNERVFNRENGGERQLMNSRTAREGRPDAAIANGGVNQPGQPGSIQEGPRQNNDRASIEERRGGGTPRVFDNANRDRERREQNSDVARTPRNWRGAQEPGGAAPRVERQLNNRQSDSNREQERARENATRAEEMRIRESQQQADSAREMQRARENAARAQEWRSREAERAQRQSNERYSAPRERAPEPRQQMQERPPQREERSQPQQGQPRQYEDRSGGQRSHGNHRAQD